MTICLSGCSNKENIEQISIKKTIKAFLDTQYDAYLQMEYKDITPYLDMSKIQNQNKVTALNRLCTRRKYVDKKGYWYVEKRRFPATLNFTNIIQKDNYARVSLEIETVRGEAYPPFIARENVFELEKIDGKWKIVNHEYGSINIFEWSKEELLRQIDLDKFLLLIDKEYNPDIQK